MSDMITNQKVRGVANVLFFDLSYARSEAIKRNVVVRVDRTGADWTGGWTVVETGGPTVLRTQPPTKGVTAAGAGNASVSFNADGRTTLGGSLSFEFTSSSSVVSKRCVLLTPSGRPAVRIDRDRNGVCADG
jgi:type IV fimbrial biogenesis protein FimT